jgi:hypothetical protein
MKDGVISACRQTVEMPHVHVAALRLQQQQQQKELSSTALSESLIMKTDSTQTHSPTCTTHSWQEQVGANQAGHLKIGKLTGDGASDGRRRMTKAENVMKEWGFENEATAKAYLHSKRRMQYKKPLKNVRRIHPTAQQHVLFFSRAILMQATHFQLSS